jgi:hypothetical protein
MTAWVLLIVAGNHRVHMMLGRIRMAINAIVEPVVCAGVRRACHLQCLNLAVGNH